VDRIGKASGEREPDGLEHDPVVWDESLEIDQGSIGAICRPELDLMAFGEESLDVVMQCPLTTTRRQIVLDGDPHDVPLGRADFAEASHTTSMSLASPQVLQSS